MLAHPPANVPINLPGPSTTSSPTNSLLPEGLSSPPQFPTTNNFVQTYVTPMVCYQMLVVLKLMRVIRSVLLMKRTVNFIVLRGVYFVRHTMHLVRMSTVLRTGAMRISTSIHSEKSGNRFLLHQECDLRNGCFSERTLGNSTLHGAHSRLES